MKRNSESGFTLIEVLVAFSILSLTIIVGFQIFSSGLNRINGIENANERLAQAKAFLLREQLLSLPSELFAQRPAATNLNLTKKTIAEEKVQWTNANPVLFQVRDGKKILLETIILSYEEPK
jgi:prepilin-type N-terminal cleavage/methylation domain-containing protein